MSRNPFDDIERMFDRMSGQLEPPEPFGGGLVEASVPVDVEDAGDEFVVTADLPGVDRDAIDVQLAGETLTVSADRESDDEASEGRYVRRERRRT